MCTRSNPTFYAKLRYAGVYIFFFFLLQNIDYGYSLEPPRRGGSNVYPQSMFWAKRRKIANFSTENFHFLQLKKYLYIAWACIIIMCSEHGCHVKTVILQQNILAQVSENLTSYSFFKDRNTRNNCVTYFFFSIMFSI